MGLAHRAIHCVVIPLTAVALLFAPLANAAPRTIALHPVVIVGGEGTESSGFAKLLDRALARRGIHPAHPEQVTAFLAHVETGACHDDACLQKLAKAANADATLFVSISPYTPRLLVSARLISAKNGGEIAAVAGREYVKGGKPLSRAVREGLEDVIQTFPFDAPEPEVRPAATATSSAHPVVVETNPQPPHPAAITPPATSSAPAAAVAAPPAAPNFITHPTLRLASYVAAGAGALALIGGTTVALAARSDRASLEHLLAKDGSRPPTDEAKALDQSLASRSRTTNLLLIGGGAALAAGATMFWLSRPSQAPQVSFVITSNGASAALAGQF